jgi:hypothetical protein
MEGESFYAHPNVSRDGGDNRDRADATTHKQNPKGDANQCVFHFFTTTHKQKPKGDANQCVFHFFTAPLDVRLKLRFLEAGMACRLDRAVAAPPLLNSVL